MKNRKCWYVQLRGQEHRLGPDKDKAYHEFHRLKAAEVPTTGKTTVAELVAQYLGWLETNRKPATLAWYQNHCQSFIGHVGARLKVSDLKPYHVDNWLKAHSKNRCKVNTGKR